MSQPSVYHLLSLLSGAEQDLLSERVAETGRKPLKNLLHFILKSAAGSKPDKEVVFLKTFGKRYTAKQDGMLRNEYAALKKMIEEIMAATIREEETAQNPLLKKIDYLKYLTKTNEYDLFEKEAEKIISESGDRFDHPMLMTVYGLYADMIFAQKKYDAKQMSKLETMIGKHRENAIRAMMVEYRRGMSLYHLAKRFPADKMEDKAYENDVDTILFADYEDEGTRYAYNKVLVNIVWDEKRIQAQLDCLKFLNLAPGFPNNAVQKFGVLMNLGTTYAGQEDHDKAIVYYEQAGELIKAQTDTRACLYYCNYATSLIHAEHYDTALQILESNKKLLATNEVSKQKVVYLKAAAYAYKRMPVELHASIPDNFTGFNKHMEIDCRFWICISYYLDGDYEMVYRECSNLHKTCHEQNEKTNTMYEATEAASTHFLHFFSAQRDFYIKRDKKKLAEKMQKLLALTKEFKTISTDAYWTYTTLFYKWLVKEIEKGK